ncbi:Initiation factor 2 beta-like protein [Coniochaeta hoffmannii]|uniref:Initiation factor 2 beta-like protein n=1 Tax=Coniochaeta hoffmannii TaxID=91930 RepID=A0AA38VPB0_9PEZI|nr:Initiation factor 2 beta-like protein [Coniochaeta hoffmannii]
MDATETHKKRKSVAFTDEKVVVDVDGHVTMVSDPIDDSKETAQSHTPPPALDAEGAGEVPANEDGLDLSLMKKKKKKSKKTEEGEEPTAAEDANDGDAAAAGGEEGALDLTLKKKKKKKVPKEGDDDFAKKLEALQLEGKEGEEPTAAAEEDEQDGDMEKGTGIWAHDESKIINYDPLLSRFFVLLTQKNPDHASSGSKSYKIPPPQCLREGNKKTIFANIADICKRMKRTDEHVTAYLFSELGTSGSVDGSRRLVIKGRFQQKQIENVLRKYIIEYVTCKTCRSPDTELNKGENRLYFITCNSCGSRRSVQAIKTGFSAQIGKRKKMQG